MTVTWKVWDGSTEEEEGAQEPEGGWMAPFVMRRAKHDLKAHQALEGLQCVWTLGAAQNNRQRHLPTAKK
jgi:hypothetical protein